MPILVDFSMARNEDATLSVSLQPPTPIGGWDLRFQSSKRHGGLSGGLTPPKVSASGFSGVSGITVVNSGQGQFNVSLNSVDSSGLDFGAYAYSIERMSSGARSVLTQGFIQILPNVG